MNELVAKKNIQDLEEVLLSMPQVEIPIVNHFADGVYGREAFIPAGATITGKIHKTSCLNVLAQGSMVIASSNGLEDEIHAPCVFVTPPNTKKAGYAMTDCVFINFFGTHETDLDKIEDEVITKDYISIGGDE